MKILDFGLAKMAETAPTVSGLSMSPTLSVHAFDAQRLDVIGGPVPLVQGIRTDGSTVHYSVSDSGSLLYLAGVVSGDVGQSDLALMDPLKGSAAPLKLPAGQYETPRVSPDGRQMAFGVDDGNDKMVWIYDLSGSTSTRRLTFGGRNRYPTGPERANDSREQSQARHTSRARGRLTGSGSCTA